MYAALTLALILLAWLAVSTLVILYKVRRIYHAPLPLQHLLRVAVVAAVAAGFTHGSGMFGGPAAMWDSFSGPGYTVMAILLALSSVGFVATVVHYGWQAYARRRNSPWLYQL